MRIVKYTVAGRTFLTCISSYMHWLNVMATPVQNLWDPHLTLLILYKRVCLSVLLLYWHILMVYMSSWKKPVL